MNVLNEHPNWIETETEEYLEWKEEFDELEFCQKKLKQDIAIAEIYFGSQFTTKLKQDVRETFTSKISNIGKYMTRGKNIFQ